MVKDTAALKYAGMMGHPVVSVATHEGDARTSGEFNTVEEARRFGKPGHRIYVRNPVTRKWRLAHTIKLA